jgi:quinoprotein glucose dehydrogenase
MYVVGKDSSVYALDAATGKQIWVHPVEGHPTNRGFNYWESKDRKDQRPIFSADGYLQEINLKTGVTIPSFGNDGKVNLREGLGRDPKSIGEIQSGTPGRVFENPIILGSAPGEMYNSPPGDLRVYDVHVVPKPRSAYSRQRPRNGPPWPSVRVRPPGSGTINALFAEFKILPFMQRG